MEIRYSKQAVKYLKKLHKPKRLQIKQYIEDRFINGLQVGKIEKLNGYKISRKFVINEYRVIFTNEDDIINIELIQSRGDAYNSAY
jgi:mRNA-degrading endonuclease RelE of RelBE toxin-antitoxin system